MDQVKKQKEAFRKKLISQRLAMDRGDVMGKSELVLQNLMEIRSIKTAKTVLLYISINNEVETENLFDYFQKNKVNIYLPGYFDDEWTFSKFRGAKNLGSGPFKTLQPKTVERLDYELDLAIIPMVGFSQKLTRLGYGKGVYDWLLGKFKTTKVGLAYESQMVEKLPTAPHDIKMDCVVTEKKIYGKIV